jgi:hypothetical protein
MYRFPSYSGRTESKCVFCDKLDPMEMAEPKKWADSPLAAPYLRDSPLNKLARNKPSDVMSLN